jgi:hypothetical protein
VYLYTHPISSAIDNRDYIYPLDSSLSTSTALSQYIITYLPARVKFPHSQTPLHNFLSFLPCTPKWHPTSRPTTRTPSPPQPTHLSHHHFLPPTRPSRTHSSSLLPAQAKVSAIKSRYPMRARGRLGLRFRAARWQIWKRSNEKS